MEQTIGMFTSNLRLITQALGTAVREMLPEGASIKKGPSFYMNEQQVMVELQGIT